MKTVKKFLKTMREVINLIVKFFKRYGLSDEILTIPIAVKKMGFRVGFMNLGMTIIALVFAFMLKATNMIYEDNTHKIDGIECQGGNYDEPR